jgi:hypothetical protein
VCARAIHVIGAYVPSRDAGVEKLSASAPGWLPRGSWPITPTEPLFLSSLNVLEPGPRPEEQWVAAAPGLIWSRSPKGSRMAGR